MVNVRLIEVETEYYQDLVVPAVVAGMHIVLSNATVFTVEEIYYDVRLSKVLFLLGKVSCGECGSDTWDSEEEMHGANWFK